MAATLDQIRASYPRAKEEWIRLHCPYSHLLQPLSMRVALLFVNLRIGANTVTGLAWLVLVAAIGVMAISDGSRLLFGLGASLLSVMMVLDNVDGHVARCTAATSRVGELLDDGLTWFHLAVLPVCLGVVLYLNEPVFSGPLSGAEPSPLIWLALSAARSVSYLLIVVLGRKADQLLGSDERRLGGCGLFALAKAVAEFEVVVLVVVALLDTLWMHHVLYTLFYLAVLSFVVAKTLSEASRMDRAHSSAERRTLHSPPKLDGRQ